MHAGTTVTSAMDCPRKAWLSEVVGGGSSVAALLGTLLHEVVQVALTASMEGPVTAQHLENTVRVRQRESKEARRASWAPVKCSYRMA